MTVNAAVCPICETSVPLRFSVPCDHRKADRPKQFDIYWCNSCDYGMVWPRPDKDQVSAFYQLENYYTHNVSTEPAIERGTKVDQFLDRLRVHLAWRFDFGKALAPEDLALHVANVSPSICEIGCGNGAHLLHFLAAGYRIVGVEPDEQALAVANSALKQQSTDQPVVTGTAEDLPAIILQQRYDVVLMSHVLEHCLDINAAVANARTLLASRGVFVVEVPNNKSLGFQRSLGIWPWADIPRHLNFFTPQSLTSVLTQNGFRVLTTKYRGFCRQFSSAWLQAELEIWEAFSRYGQGRDVAPKFNRRAWQLLLKTLPRHASLKYDSVRIVAIAE